MIWVGTLGECYRSTRKFLGRKTAFDIAIQGKTEYLLHPSNSNMTKIQITIAKNMDNQYNQAKAKIP
jgi:hypothetical protein